ncbi:MAG: histidine kinase, partial [Chloroflexia bacterium]|nr:histidine kinase [Chloroflexia bacterium]
MFNALNTIYFQMDESVDAAKQSIEKLSDLLRYRLYDDDSVKVSLAKEIEYLKKYIQFQAIRSSESLKITTKFDQPHNGEQVYPFLFLPCIENAFKYVSGEMWIDIALSIKNSNIEFAVSNSIDSKVLEMSNSRGIGLQNLEKRLALLYK